MILAIAIAALLPDSAHAVSVAFLANVVFMVACVPGSPWYGHVTLAMGLAMALLNRGQAVVAVCLWVVLEVGIARECKLLPRRFQG